MAIDPSEFRQAMGHFATGVTVVTTRDDDRWYGFTANAVCSVSLVPALVLVCVDKRAESHSTFSQSGVFAVNVLADHQAMVSQRFAVSGGEKFDGLPYYFGETGVPILEGAIAYVECTLSATHDAGDHTIYVGEVTHASASSGAPLLFFRGRYRRLQDI